MNLVVDSSAVVAILMHEDDGPSLLETLASASARCISSVSLLEIRIVLEMGKRSAAERLDELLARWAIAVVPFDEALSALAFEAYRRYGKGRHPARLNLGDCAAYALARSRGWPLLFKGDDFARTDVEPA